MTPVRSALPRATSHATAHAAPGGTLVRDHHDRRALLAALRVAARRRGWSCLGWCVLDTHVHLLVTASGGDLEAGLAGVRAAYARHVRARHGLGRVPFDLPFAARPVRSGAHLLAAVRHVALSPVAAGVVGEPAAWPWSHHRAGAGLAVDGLTDIATLQGHFAAWGADGRAGYAAFVAEGLEDARLRARAAQRGAAVPSGPAAAGVTGLR